LKSLLTWPLNDKN